MKKILQWKLKLLAKLYLLRYRPKVIGITGSVGKTTTKETIDLALNNNFHVRSSQKSYNNQIGLPLTILGFETAGKNIFGWFIILLKSFGRLFFDANHPQILVLEMGSDRIGDLDYLVGIVKPNISVITAVGAAHTEAFGNLENVAREKSVLVKVLDTKDYAVLNYDDQSVLAMANQTKAKKIFYGLNKNSDIFANNIKMQNKRLIFDIKINNNFFNFSINNAGKHLVYPILAAVCVGTILKIEPEKMIKSLSNFKPLSGRGKILKGKNKNLIIDESYNASPISVTAALNFLHDIQTKQKKIAILGDMKELGEKSLLYHQNLANEARFADIIIFVGKEVVESYKILKNQHPAVYYFDSANSLAKKLTKLIGKDSLILVKGSQAVRLELIVEKLINKHYNKEAVLVRQSKEWQKQNN